MIFLEYGYTLKVYQWLVEMEFQHQTVHTIIKLVNGLHNHVFLTEEKCKYKYLCDKAAYKN